MGLVTDRVTALDWDQATVRETARDLELSWVLQSEQVTVLERALRLVQAMVREMVLAKALKMALVMVLSTAQDLVRREHTVDQTRSCEIRILVRCDIHSHEQWSFHPDRVRACSSFREGRERFLGTESHRLNSRE